MKTNKSENILLVGLTSKKVEKIDHLLEQYFSKVVHVSGCSEIDKTIALGNFEFIILTDSNEDPADDNVAPALRKWFPDSKILGLFDRIDPATERILRSLGMIFLGSYDLFINQIATIIRPAIKKQKPTLRSEDEQYINR